MASNNPNQIKSGNDGNLYMHDGEGWKPVDVKRGNDGNNYANDGQGWKPIGSALEPEEQKAFGDSRPDITPTSTVGKLALGASHGYLGNALPWLEGQVAKVLPNPAGLTREDYANALNKSREDTGMAGTGAEIAGAIANPALRAAGPAGGGALMGAGESASQGGGLPEVVKSAGLNAMLGKAGDVALGAVARRFPALADRLAERITNQPAKSAASRYVNTLTGNYEPGKYAQDVLEYGLNKLTSGGVSEAAVDLKRGAGAALDELRGGGGTKVADALGVVQKGIAAAPEGSGASRVLKQFEKELLAKGEDVSFDELANHTQNYVNEPLKSIGQVVGSAEKPLEVRALSGVKQGLEDLQTAKMNPDQIGAYNEARKQYAIGSQALGGSSEAAVAPLSAHGLIRRGALGVVGHLLGSAVGLPGLGTLAGIAAGGRPGAYMALKAYQAARTAPAQMLAKAAGAAGPGVQSAVARATASGQPEQAGAAIQKAQANDPKAR